MLDDGAEAGVWLASNQKSYDLTYTRDATGTRGRLHHIAFFVDQREDVLRAADIFLEHGVVIESGPHKHAIQQTFFLYTYEPGGNRIEVCAGGFLIFDPDHEPVVWSQAERAKGQAWGMQTVASFHIKGTPPCPRRKCFLPAARPLSPRPARASSSAAPTTSTSTSSRTSPQRRIDDLALARRFAELGLAGFVLKSHYVPTAERAAVVRAAVPGVRRARRDRAERRRRRAERAGGRDRRARRRADRLAADGRLPRTRRARTARSPPSSRSGARSRTSSSPPASRAGRCELTDERPRARCSRSSRATTSCSRRGISAAREIHTAVDAALAGRRSRRRRDPSRLSDPGRAGRRAGGAGRARRAARALLRADPHRQGLVGADVRGDSRDRRRRDNVLSTDLGQVTNPPVEDGLALMADRLLEAGFAEDDIHTMAVVNTRRLAGALRRSWSSARTRPTSSGAPPARSPTVVEGGGVGPRRRALLRRAGRVGRALEGARPDRGAREGDPPRRRPRRPRRRSAPDFRGFDLGDYPLVMDAGAVDRLTGSDPGARAAA